MNFTAVKRNDIASGNFESEKLIVPEEVSYTLTFHSLLVSGSHNILFNLKKCVLSVTQFVVFWTVNMYPRKHVKGENDTNTL